MKIIKSARYNVLTYFKKFLYKIIPMRKIAVWAHELSEQQKAQLLVEMRPLVDVIRANPRVGRGSLTTIDEAMEDVEIAAELKEEGITDEKSAIEWAIRVEGMTREQGLNARWGEHDDPQKADYDDWMKQSQKLPPAEPSLGESIDQAEMLDPNTDDDPSPGIKDTPAERLQSVALSVRFFAKNMEQMTPELMNELADNLVEIARDMAHKHRTSVNEIN